MTSREWTAGLLMSDALSAWRDNTNASVWVRACVSRNRSKEEGKKLIRASEGRRWGSFSAVLY